MEDYCDIVDRSTYDANIQEIMRIFKAILSGQASNDLKLLNYYKGVPISYKTSLVEVENDTITLELHPNQVAAVGKTLKTFITSSNFRKDILADVFVLSPGQQEVCLRNFIYTDVLSLKRNYIRIDMDEPTDTQIKIEDEVVIGKLLDVSLVSIAVALPDEVVLAPETRVGVTMRLPSRSNSASVDIQAEALYLKRVETQNFCKYVFTLVESKLNESFLSQYLMQRQMEIMKEIKELHWAL
jgi:hypothetical protein